MRRLILRGPVMFLLACGSSSPAAPSPADGGSSASTDAPTDSAGDAGGDDPTQVPPTGGAAAIEAWLAQGYYKAWACDPAMRAAKAPSKNVMTRICNNTAASTGVAGPYPVGAAFVEEVGDATGAVIGHAVQRKVAAGGAESIYWYGKFDADAAPLADGLGSAADVQSACVDCHARAGADAGIGHDFVFTQLP